MVAVMVTGPPAATPVTSPEALTDATAGLLLDQVVVRPVRVAPAADLAVAVSCVVAPMSMLLVPGSRTTVATGTSCTVTIASPFLPPLEARICAVPAETAVTMPEADTLATAWALEVHATGLPESGLPEASRTVAVSWVVSPTSRLAVTGETETEATSTVAGVTVIWAAPVLPSLVAVMRAVPADTAVTSPDPLTRATASASLDQARFLARALPPASRA
ncbi:MAG TPA: hypothetical protein PLL69_09875 [Gemmatimonadales bacterium]|nr:hypothetical protein [Gemmatimonadales bacterium]